MVISYYISCGNPYDGKSVCLWRQEGNVAYKIARFQSNTAAKMFAEEFNFPLSDRLKQRFREEEKQWTKRLRTK